MLGIWNKDIRRQHTVHRTKLEEYMNSEQISSIIYDHHEIPSMLHTTRLLDNTTYAPIGRIALYADTMNLRRINQLLKKSVSLHKLNILGRRVDCIYFSTTQKDARALKGIIEGGNYLQVRADLKWGR